MHSTGWAFAYALWTRHSFVMVAILTYLLGLILVVNALPAGTLNPRIIPPLTIPLWFALVFLLLVFCQEDKPDFLSNKSGYPRRLFSVPLSSAALVGWPFALGAATLILFWLLLSGLILGPAGIPSALLWPTVFLVATLAWLQALSWWHFPVPMIRNLLRVTVALLMFIGLVIAGIYCGLIALSWGERSQFTLFEDSVGAIFEKPPGEAMYWAAASIPLACLVSFGGVARVRRGDVPVWHLLALLRGGAGPLKEQRPFTSAAQAMFRFQWTRHGLILPLMVSPAVVLGIAIILLFTNLVHEVAARRGIEDVEIREVFESLVQIFVGILVGIMVYTTLMAHAAGALLGSGRPWSRKFKGMQPFLTCRPVTTAALIGVKIRVATWSVLCTWAMIFLALYCACLPMLTAFRAQQVDWPSILGLADTPVVKCIAVLLVVLIGLLVFTWKEYVSQLWVGMRGQTLSSLPLHVAPLLGFFVLFWVFVETRWVLPWLLSGALALKLIVGASIVMKLRRRGLVGERILLRLGIAWMVAAAAIAALACWLTPAGEVSPWTVANAGILLLLPLVRVGLAPLVMDQSRHQ